MGVDKQSFKFIRDAKKLASRTVSEPKVLFLGKPTVIEEATFGFDDFRAVFKDCRLKSVDFFRENNCDYTLDICSSKIDEKFDFIVDHGTLQHVYNPFEAIRNIYSSLNSGGVILHIVPISGYENFGYFQFSVEWFEKIYADTYESIQIFIISEAWPNRYLKVNSPFNRRLVGRWRIVVVVVKSADMDIPKFAQEGFANGQPDIVQSSYCKYRARLGFFRTSFYSLFRL